MDLFMEASAKTGFNAINVFVEAAYILYKDYLKYKDKLDEVIIHIILNRDLQVQVL